MKQGIHPEYREVVFLDSGTDTKYLTRSTVASKETIELDDKTYPLVRVDISAASHPFYTGKMKYVDSAGRVEKFQKKYDWEKRRRKARGKDSDEPAETEAN